MRYWECQGLIWESKSFGTNSINGWDKNVSLPTHDCKYSKALYQNGFEWRRTLDKLSTDEEHGRQLQQTGGGVHVFAVVFGSRTVVVIVVTVFTSVVPVIAVVTTEVSEVSVTVASSRIFVHASRETRRFISRERQPPPPTRENTPSAFPAINATGESRSFYHLVASQSLDVQALRMTMVMAAIAGTAAAAATEAVIAKDCMRGSQAARFRTARGPSWRYPSRTRFDGVDVDRSAGLHDGGRTVNTRELPRQRWRRRQRLRGRRRRERNGTRPVNSTRRLRTKGSLRRFTTHGRLQCGPKTDDTHTPHTQDRCRCWCAYYGRRTCVRVGRVRAYTIV